MLKVTPCHTFTIVVEDNEIEYDDEENPYPPESAIRQEFAEEIMNQKKNDYKNQSFDTTDDFLSHINNLGESDDK